MPLTGNAERQAPLAALEARTGSMIDTLRALCEINSGSRHLSGIRQVQAGLHQLFAPLSDTVEYRELAPLSQIADNGSLLESPCAPMQIFRARPDAALQILFTGHSDTVFPANSAFNQCEIRANRLHGPGTADMKGGLVMLAEALHWLQQSPLKDHFGFTLAISPDEEIGSPSSAPVLAELAAQAHVGMTYEPALEDGTLAGARKGSGNFTLSARGHSTHAGRDFFSGRNAVLAIADAAQQLAQLSDQQQGITVNIGQISGGGAVNVVPDQCICRFNVRMNETAQMAVLEQQMQQIVQKVQASSGCELTLHGHFNRPPKPMNERQQALFSLLHECGAELGLDIRWVATGGCCEGNNLAAAGLANIDTLGVRGANIHTEQEYACTDSFAERAALTVVFIEKLIQRKLSTPDKENPALC